MMLSLVLALFCGCGSSWEDAAMAPPPTLQAKPRFVYAHYMHCFVYGEKSPVIAGSEHWDSWTSSEFASPAWWPEQFARHANDGETAITQDFAWGQRAGVDAFGVLTAEGPAWWDHYGPTLNAVADVASSS